MAYYPEHRFVVTTTKPAEADPGDPRYIRIERGTFSSIEAAFTFQMELAEMGEASQCTEHYWQEIEKPRRWMRAKQERSSNQPEAKE